MHARDDMHHVDINLGGLQIKTKQTYTVEQAREMSELLLESARMAMGCSEIEPRPLTLTERDGTETVLGLSEAEPIYAPGWFAFTRGIGITATALCVSVSLAALAGAGWMVAMALGEVLG